MVWLHLGFSLPLYKLTGIISINQIFIQRGQKNKGSSRLTNPYFFLPAERGRLSDDPMSQHNGHNSKKCRTPFGYDFLSINNKGKFRIVCFQVCPVNDLHILKVFSETETEIADMKNLFYFPFVVLFQAGGSEGETIKTGQLAI